MLRACLVAFIAILAVPLGSRAQLSKGNFDFHTRPRSVCVNPFLRGTYYYSDTAGLIYKTISRQPLAFVASTLPLDSVYDYYFSSVSNGLVCGKHGMLATTDTGTSWTPIKALCSPGAGWRQLFFERITKVLYAVSSASGLWRSLDLGSHWEQVLKGKFGGMYIYDGRGVLTAANGGECYYTRDAGATWIKSKDQVISGRPGFDASERVFVAAITRGHDVLVSSDGSEWTRKSSTPYVLMGDVFLQCDRWLIPFEGGYLMGPLYALDFTLLGVAPEEFIYSKDDVGLRYVRNYNSQKLYLETIATPAVSIHASDLIVTVPRCSTVTRRVTAGVATKAKLGVVVIRIVPVKTHPAIKLLGPESRPLANTLDLDFEITGTRAGAKATYMLETESCVDTPAFIEINVTPSPSPAKVSSERVNFGNVGICNSLQKWVKFNNEDCDTIEWRGFSIAQSGTTFRMANDPAFPRRIPPLTSDSVLVELKPQVVGAASAVTKLDYTWASGQSSITSLLQGSVSSSLAASADDDTLNFGAITSCDPATTKTWLKNTGCERLKIKSLSLPNNSRFAIKSSPLGEWMLPDEVIELDVEALTDQAGDFAQELEFKATSEAGATVTLRVELISSVRLPETAHSLSSADSIKGLTTCNTLDTSVTITNLSTCQDLQITDVRVSHPAITLLYPFAPVSLKPGESATYRLRLSGAGQTAIADKVLITTDLFGVVSTDITATVDRARLASLDVSEPTEAFATTQCKAVTREYSISSEGCGYLPLNAIKLQTVSGAASRFTMENVSVALPHDLVEGENVKFSITFDPDLSGEDAAEIVIEDDQGLPIRFIPIAGKIDQTKTTFGLDMKLDRTDPLKIDDRLHVSILATDAVPQSAGLTKIQTALHFDRDLFTIENIDVPSGASISRNETSDGEGLTFTSSAFSLSKEDVLATIALRPSVTTHTSSDIALTGLILNDSDENFMRCVMTPATTLSTSNAFVLLDCHERVIQDALNGSLMLSVSAIYPQPADASGVITVDLVSASSDMMDVVVTDALGREELRTTRSIPQGSSSITLPTLHSGYHTLMVRSSNGNNIRSLIVR
jgi:hypothetical protein